ncbi:MAG TPA: DUF4157 domain-containing protein, partial [Kofleriaceae bacterium]|nr:DUF4157 domain-containing protein [Kofleriaceae bacterium]
MRHRTALEGSFWTMADRTRDDFRFLYNEEGSSTEPAYYPRVSPGKRSLTAGLSAVRRDPAGSAVQPNAREQVEAAAGGSGEPLPVGLRGRLEGALGADLSGVRTHQGGNSARAATALSANAFAQGQDIHFAPGRYDPESPAGERLIAHEVAHTVQQQGASSADPQADLEVSSPGDRHEQEAETFAQAFVRGETSMVSPVSRASVSRQVIHRDPPQAAPAPPVADPSYAPGEGTFAPRVEKDENAAIKMFEHHIHTFKLANAAQAPEGTTYHWGNGIDATGVLTLIGSDTQNDD